MKKLSHIAFTLISLSILPCLATESLAFGGGHAGGGRGGEGFAGSCQAPASYPAFNPGNNGRAPVSNHYNDYNDGSAYRSAPFQGDNAPEFNRRPNQYNDHPPAFRNNYNINPWHYNFNEWSNDWVYGALIGSTMSALFTPYSYAEPSGFSNTPNNNNTNTPSSSCYPDPSAYPQSGTYPQSDNAADLPDNSMWTTESTGQAPSNAIIFRKENGKPVFYCRAQYKDEWLYGVLIPQDACYVQDQFVTMRFTLYDVLVRRSDY